MKRTLRWRELGILLLIVLVSTVGVILSWRPFFNQAPSFIGASRYGQLFFKDDVLLTALYHTLLPLLLIAATVGVAWLVLKRMLRRASSKLTQGWYDLICYAALFWGNGAAWIIWRYIESASTAATLAGPVRMEIWSVSHVSFTVFGSSLLLLIFFGLDCLADVLTRLFKGKADKPHG